MLLQKNIKTNLFNKFLLNDILKYWIKYNLLFYIRYSTFVTSQEKGKKGEFWAEFFCIIIIFVLKLMLY